MEQVWGIYANIGKCLTSSTHCLVALLCLELQLHSTWHASVGIWCIWCILFRTSSQIVVSRSISGTSPLMRTAWKEQRCSAYSTHMHAYGDTQPDTYICKDTYMHAHARTCTHQETHVQTHPHICTHARTCTHMHAHAHTCTHAHTKRHMCKHTCTYAHMCAHTHRNRERWHTRPGGGHALAHALFDSWEANIPSVHLQVYHLLSVHNRTSTNANQGWHHDFLLACLLPTPVDLFQMTARHTFPDSLVHLTCHCTVSACGNTDWTTYSQNSQSNGYCNTIWTGKWSAI